MTNDFGIIINVIMAVITSVVVILVSLRGRGRSVTKAFLFFCLSLFGWQILSAAFYATAGVLSSRFLYDAKHAFVALSSIALFFLIFDFYVPDHPLRRNKAILLLLIVPMITAALALTSPLHQWFRTDVVVLQTVPVHVISGVDMPWFWMHCLYSYGAVLCAMLISLVHHSKLPKQYRKQSIIVNIGLVVSLLVNIFVFFFHFTYLLDYALGGLTLLMIILFVCLSSSDNMGFLVLARDEIFFYLEDCVFILDKSNTIIESNLAARMLVKETQAPQSETTFDALLAFMSTDYDRKSVSEIPSSHGIDLRIGIPATGQQRIYNFRERPIRDKSSRVLGHYVMLTDITRYQRLIDQLEESSGIDPLTGLLNRRRFEKEKVNLAGSLYLPLSVIVGDVNRLKYVNDTYGHNVGDLMLRVVAQVFSELCPEHGSVYRIGGDEYVMLLPNTTFEQAERIIETCRDVLARIKRYPFPISMAMGSATRQDLSEGVDELIQHADSAMYKRKGTM